MTDNAPRILIVRTDRIGDVVLTLPMAKALRARFPGAHIAMLIRRYTRELAEDCKELDRVIFYDETAGLVPLFELVATLRESNFDIVFHTYPRFRLSLITWFSRIPVRVGTGYRWYSFLFNKPVYDHRKTAEHHELEYNLRLLDAVGFGVGGMRPAVDTRPRLPVSEEAWNAVAARLRTQGIVLGAESRKIVILHPGSGGSARDWSPERFAELAHRLIADANAQVIITGGEHERNLVESVRAGAGNGALGLAGGMSLREFGALASMASVFVSNSTGPLHIAAAVGTPVVGLYPLITALSARRWGPYTDAKIIHTPHDRPADCQTCESAKGMRCACMETITVDEVYTSVTGLLSSRRAASH